METEQRIALARGYFNDIVTSYNVRHEVIPDRWISKLSRLKPRALWEAEDFERAPVAVSLATWPDGPTVKKSMDRKPYR